jgi:hypothetical protein
MKQQFPFTSEKHRTLPAGTNVLKADLFLYFIFISYKRTVLTQPRGFFAQCSLIINKAS